jgi:NADPH:quinone reductase-like Zn-dependent oxidoreductase
MRAAVIARYGPPEVVKVCEVPRPAPAPGELLIRVHATTVTRTDTGGLRPTPPLLGRLLYGLLRPRRAIYGLDVAGEVAAVGAGVTAFKPGDRVFGLCPFQRDGAQAEYVCAPADGAVARMPEGLAFTEAVVCEGAYYADAGLKQYRVGPGHRILVYGASGAIGSAAVQLAKAYGAEVTAVVAPRHLAMARALGADQVIDYTAGDFTRTAGRFDFVFEAVGKTSYFRLRRLLKPGGIFMATDIGPWGHYLPLVLWSALTRRPYLVVPLPPRGSGPGFIAALKALMEAGRFHAVVDRTYPLDAIAEAYRYVETGQKAGIVAIEVVGG